MRKSRNRIKAVLLMLALAWILSGCSKKSEDQQKYSCRISISCENLIGNDALLEEKQTLVPENGFLMEPREVLFEEGESVFDVLLREARADHLHMEYEKTPAFNSVYIEGIGNLYEFDAGPMSGWMFRVNGEFPNYGCSAVQVQDGDVIEWLYTCDLGKDVGSKEPGEVES